jgi:serine/threonine-protein kinase
VLKATAEGAPRFEPREEIGRGPLGIVFRAEDRTDGRSVALRVLREELLHDSGTREAVFADIKAAAALSHPNLVKVLGLVTIDSKTCVVTELIEDSRTFAEPLRTGQRMPFEKTHLVARVLTQALAFVHGRGLVHGSVQPSNIMVARGAIKLADLGLGRLAQKVAPYPNYQAPEGVYDAVSDIYSLAAVLYHLVTGVHPKSQPQGVALPLPSQLTRGVPESFDRFLIRGLHPEREHRFASTADMIEQLKATVRLG